jgi:sec-independent protein translocase protein TatA
MNVTDSLAFIQNLGWQEILLILIIILLLFGAKRLPELARSVGKSMKEFKKATSEAEQTFKQALEEEDHKPHTAKPQQPAAPTQRAEAETAKAPAPETPAEKQ